MITLCPGPLNTYALKIQAWNHAGDQAIWRSGPCEHSRPLTHVPILKSHDFVSKYPYIWETFGVFLSPIIFFVRIFILYSDCLSLQNAEKYLHSDKGDKLHLKGILDIVFMFTSLQLIQVI